MSFEAVCCGLGNLEQGTIKWDGLAYGRFPATSLTIPALSSAPVEFWETAEERIQLILGHGGPRRILLVLPSNSENGGWTCWLHLLLLRQMWRNRPTIAAVEGFNPWTETQPSSITSYTRRKLQAVMWLHVDEIFLKRYQCVRPKNLPLYVWTRPYYTSPLEKINPKMSSLYRFTAYFPTSFNSVPHHLLCLGLGSQLHKQLLPRCCQTW